MKGLARAYREGESRHTVLQSVDLRVADGECVALLGRSGSGKSTMLNLVSGIDRPDEGVVRVAGADLTAMDERERTLFRRRHIGFVYQFFNLIPTLTVAENVALPLDLLDVPASDQARRVETLLSEVGLEALGAAFPDRLSGGEQQRVAVARALVHEPRLVLADEPTGNLDAETGQAVLDLLERLVRSRGRTMLVVTHSREVAAFADRVVTLDHGRLRPVVADPAA
jgi:putative ABC transport system ATP-binding protein